MCMYVYVLGLAVHLLRSSDRFKEALVDGTMDWGIRKTLHVNAPCTLLHRLHDDNNDTTFDRYRYCFWLLVGLYVGLLDSSQSTSSSP